MLKCNRTARIRDLNDQYRRFRRGHGRTLVTSGIAAEGNAFVAKVLACVQAFEDFSLDNDPHLEHDFGALTVDGLKVFWKIDLYDPTLTAGSEDPTDETKTCRVLTVMLSHEY